MSLTRFAVLGLVLTLLMASLGAGVAVTIFGSFLASEFSRIVAGLDVGSAAQIREAAALLDPAVRAGIDPVTLAILQSALAGALAPVFWGIALLSVGALLVGLWFPRLHVDQLAGAPTQVPRGVGKATRQTTR